MTVEPYTYAPTARDHAVYEQVRSWSPDTFPSPDMLPKLGAIVKDGEGLICFLCADVSSTVPRAFLDYLQTNPDVSPIKRHRAVMLAEAFLVGQLQEAGCVSVTGISIHPAVATLSTWMGYQIHEKAVLVFTKEI